MTYPTHKQYAISFSFIAAMLLYQFNLTQINYYFMLPIIISVAKYGGLFPDIDHSWQNVKDKTVPNLIINKLIHLTGGRHRSWQTHSIDIVIVATILCYMSPEVLYKYNKIDIINKEILSIILVGFCAGWISHIIADMMTSGGVRLFCWNRKLIIRLVPRNIGKLKFNTGHEWEEFVYRCTKKINIILGVLCILYPIITNQNLIELIKSFIRRT